MVRTLHLPANVLPVCMELMHLTPMLFVLAESSSEQILTHSPLGVIGNSNASTSAIYAKVRTSADRLYCVPAHNFGVLGWVKN